MYSTMGSGIASEIVLAMSASINGGVCFLNKENIVVGPFEWARCWARTLNLPIHSRGPSANSLLALFVPVLEAGRGWLLSDGKSHRYDQGGSLDDAAITYRDECPVALVERELSRDGDDVTVKITFDNATGVRARVDSHLTRRGEHEFAVSLFSPALP